MNNNDERDYDEEEYNRRMMEEEGREELEFERKQQEAADESWAETVLEEKESRLVPEEMKNESGGHRVVISQAAPPLFEAIPSPSFEEASQALLPTATSDDPNWVDVGRVPLTTAMSLVDGILKQIESYEKTVSDVKRYEADALTYEQVAEISRREHISNNPVAFMDKPVLTKYKPEDDTSGPFMADEDLAFLYTELGHLYNLLNRLCTNPDLLSQYREWVMKKYNTRAIKKVKVFKPGEHTEMSIAVDYIGHETGYDEDTGLYTICDPMTGNIEPVGRQHFEYIQE